MVILYLCLLNGTFKIICLLIQSRYVFILCLYHKLFLAILFSVTQLVAFQSIAIYITSSKTIQSPTLLVVRGNRIYWKSHQVYMNQLTASEGCLSPIKYSDWTMNGRDGNIVSYTVFYLPNSVFSKQFSYLFTVFRFHLQQKINFYSIRKLISTVSSRF